MVKVQSVRDILDNVYSGLHLAKISIYVEATGEGLPVTEDNLDLPVVEYFEYTETGEIQFWVW